MKNYLDNISNCDNIIKNNEGYNSDGTSYQETGCINGQGKFDKLKFAGTTFGDVGCEILATYNAMVRENISVDLCRLIVEFEINVIQITGPFADGKAGSKPENIPDCLKSYSLNPEYTDRIIYISPFKKTDSQNDNIKKIENKLNQNGKVILSAWNYIDGKVDIASGVHTVYIEKGKNNIIVYNSTNNSTEPEMKYSSVEDLFTNKDDTKFNTLVIGIWGN